MKIAFIEIHNFRKLKSCRVEFAEKETVFVGANNSGKTSAIDALILFLEKTRRKSISTTDFTLSNWICINKIASNWATTKEQEKINLNIESWRPYIPVVDIWLEVNDDQIHYVSHLIPTLNWSGGLLGVRLSFEPKNIEKLYKEFISDYSSARSLTENSKNKKKALKLWPNSMRDFLDRKLHSHFEVKAYIFDPEKQNNPIDGISILQELPPNSIELERDPFEGLIKINSINAQRGFSDANSTEGISENSSSGRLTTQLRSYYTKHLDPAESPGEDDLDALEVLESARSTFDEKLRDGFKQALAELEGLGYPGFSNPELILTSKINPVDVLNHDTAVRFNIGKNEDNDGNNLLHLPEKYNGLGYQNLISMVFSLIRFRDEWMRKGKFGKSFENDDKPIEPLHIVLIEEPEAHLHAQVQQVFIKKAYQVLRNHENLKDKAIFNTQLVVSTHSSHIAHEIDFACLRYFRRNPSEDRKIVPSANVVNLSTIFGSQDDTSRFAARYLKTTHCDLFFADAAILVEGPAERMLVPHFIRHKYPCLDSRYISILEIGGSHAHRLKPLIEALGIITLIITDIDSIGQTDTKRVRPERDKNYRTGNDSLKNWLPRKVDLDDLYKSPEPNKFSANGKIRIAYQNPVSVNYFGTVQEALPYTFEDSFALSNIEFIKGITSVTGLLKKVKEALSENNLASACEKMFDALNNGKKAEMALELLFYKDPKEFQPPEYIADGLQWLEDILRDKDIDYKLATGGKDESCE